MTGVNNLTLGIWGIDAGTGQTIPLTPNQQGQYFGAGVASIVVSIAAAGANQPPTTITIPNPRNLLPPPPAVAIPGFGAIPIPAAPPIQIPLPIANLTTATVTIAGTNYIIMMSTAGTNGGGGGPAVPAGGNGNPTPSPQTGSLFERTFQTPKGPVGFLAEVEVSGKTLHLKDVVIYGEGSTPLTGLMNEVLAARTHLINEARAMGFEQLRITGQRVESSSSANPGHLVDITFDLTM